ncbi:MAG: Ig-like domain-containing protein [Gemmatimonadaceae bacterium]|nr:Ig-like domain-containing protein [Gemmatimonadaceae bacterium]
MTMRSLLRVIALVVGAGLSTACKGLGDMTAPRPVETPISSVVLSTEQLTLSEGSSIALQVTARDANNRPITDRTVFWSSNDSTIARVSSAGLVSALRPGSAQIAASVDGRSAVAQLTVTARGVASVQVTPTTPSLLKGGFLQLTARTLDETGALLTGRPVFWGSSDAKVAVVDVAGLVTGIAPGVATVTATSESRTAAVGVTVSPVPVSSVQLTPTRDSVVLGQATQLTATPRDSTGARLDDLVTFTTNAGSIATVSSSGLVLGISPGTAIVTASSGGKSATATIIVQPRPVGAVIVSPAQSLLTVGQTVRLTVQITDGSGNLLTGRPLSFSSSNVNVAQVAADGTVTASAQGSATITVTSEGKTGTATITVAPSPIASLRVEPSTAALLVGGATTLQTVALDAGGNVLAQRVVTWTSGAPSVVSVSSAGVVNAVGPGTALVFAAAEGRLATATITVTAITPSTVVVTPTTATVIAGQSLDLTATLRDGAGTVVSGRTVQWISSNSTVAIVSSTGRVRGVAPGVARIDATADGVTGSSSLTIVPVPIVTVNVNLAVASIIVGQTTQASAVARDSIGGVLTGRLVGWTSSNTAVATVSSTGVVTAIALGTANIIATSEGKVGQAAVSVVVGSPTTIAANSAIAQSATAGTVVTAPPSVKVTDAGGTPVSGVSVTFTLTGGGGAIIPASPVSITTNAGGIAALTSWTLGAVAGANTVTAAVSGLAGSPVTFSATGTVGTPTTMVANSVLTQTATVLTAVAVPPSVTVTDVGGNPVAGVVVTFARTVGTGVLVPATPASVSTNASGIATLTSWTLGATAGANAVTAAVTGLTGSPVTFTATGTVGAATTLLSNSVATQSALVGAAVSAPPSVKVTDAGGNGISGVSVTFTLATGGGTIAPPSPAVLITNASGVATLTTWTLGAIAGPNSVTAAATGLTGSPLVFTATGTAGTPTTIAANSVVTQSAVAGSAVAAPPSVRVADASNNPVSGVSVTFTTTVGGGTLSPPSPAIVSTNALGIATLTSWTLGTTVGANAVSATATGLAGSPVLFAATGTVGAASQLVLTTQPAGAVTALPFVTQPVLEIRDVNGNRTSSTAAVTVAVGSGVGVLSGTTTVAAVNGVATFTNLVITGPGAHTLLFTTTTPALSRTSTSFTVTAGAPTTIAANSVLTQSATVLTAVTAPPSVKVTDVGGNPVSGVTVTFTRTVGGGVIVPATPASVATNALGIATLTSWTLGATAGTNTVTAVVTGLTGSPVTFNATGTVGAPSQLVLTTQPAGAVSGVAFTTQPVLAIRDAGNNVTASAAVVTVVLASGSGVLSGTLAVNAVNGVATFTNLQIVGTGPHTLQFTTTTPALSVTSSSVTIGAGPATQLAITTQPAGAVSGVAFTTQPVIAIRDASGNLTSSAATVTASLASGLGALSGTLTATAVNGVATFTNLKIAGPGAHTLTFTSGALTSATSNAVTVTQRTRCSSRPRRRR